ncbi:MAG: hypothetical protein WD077_12895 [Bacteroidia bacterium]
MWKYPTFLLILLRFLSVTMLTIFLLSPFIRTAFKSVEEPVIAVAIDNSQSILLNKDSLEYKQQLRQRITEVAGALGQDYKVDIYTFGDRATPGDDLDFSEPATNYSQLFREMQDRYTNQNLGAVILATDGIYNQGVNPLFSSRPNVPIYTLALGDTIPPRDLVLRDVRHNDIVYQGNEFPIQIETGATELAGANATLTITHEGKTVHSSQFEIEDDDFRIEENVFLQANEPGVQKYTLRLTPQEGEISLRNNSQDIFIEVLDSRKAILLLAAAPHPDIAALRKLIAVNERYEVETAVLRDFMQAGPVSAESLGKYHMVILHQLPDGGAEGQRLISMLNEEKVPMLLVLGTKTNFGQLNNLDLGIEISPGGRSTNEVLPRINDDFDLFMLSRESVSLIRDMPPLISTYGNYRFTGDNQVLLHQQIGQVETALPLMAFMPAGTAKTGVIAGEGIWRWYLHNFLETGNHKAMEELLSKTIQYLSLRADKRFFRLQPAKNIFFENEAVRFEAEVYNQSYEPVQDAQVRLTLRDTAGNEYNYAFVPARNRYSLNAGYLPAGSYDYTGSVNVGNQSYSLSGQIVVKSTGLEYLQTVANHRLLFGLSEESGGNIFWPGQEQQLLEAIQQREDLAAISYVQFDLRELINLKVFFFILLLLLAAEWFLRKYYGSY